MHRVLGVGVLLLALSAFGDGARGQTDDGPGGMTCRDFIAAAHQAWEHVGGDWVDAQGQPQGERPFGSVVVSRAKSAQPVQWDATALVAQWDEPGAWRGAVLLRSLPSARAGRATFVSREGEDRAARPVLALRWSDGEEALLSPVADTHLACPSHRSAGRESQLKLGSEQPAVLLFEVPRRAGQRVVKATLSLLSQRQTGAGATLGLFAARRPGGVPGPVQSGLAAEYPLDRGLERHPEVLWIDRFETPAATRKWLDEDDAARVQWVGRAGGAGRFEPLDGMALAATLPAGGSQALNSHIALERLAGGPLDEAYLRYYLRLADNWDPTVDGGKLPGLAGTYRRGGWGGRKADGYNGWSARGSFLRQTEPGSGIESLRALGYYVYHAAMTDRYGDGWGWNLAPGGLLQKNRWYSIEHHVRLNTPGRADGVLRAWVDGRLVFSRTDLRFRDTDALHIESVWMNVYHGGTKPAPKEMTLYLDNLVVARRYIGPMTGGAHKP